MQEKAALAAQYVDEYELVYEPAKCRIYVLSIDRAFCIIDIKDGSILDLIASFWRSDTEHILFNYARELPVPHWIKNILVMFKGGRFPYLQIQSAMARTFVVLYKIFVKANVIEPLKVDGAVDLNTKIGDLYRQSLQRIL